MTFARGCGEVGRRLGRHRDSIRGVISLTESMEMERVGCCRRMLFFLVCSFKCMAAELGFLSNSIRTRFHSLRGVLYVGFI